MNIAVLITDSDVSRLGKNLYEVFIFGTKGGVITSIGREKVLKGNTDHLILLLVNHRVKSIYVDKPSGELRAFARKSSMDVKPLKAISENPVLHSLLVNL